LPSIFALCVSSGLAYSAVWPWANDEIVNQIASTGVAINSTNTAGNSPYQAIISRSAKNQSPFRLDGNASPVLKITSMTASRSNQMTLQCEGVPNSKNKVIAAPDLSSGFTTTLDTLTADSNGNFQFTDPNSSNLSTRFYILKPQS
jgi:hypothetical protein